MYICDCGDFGTCVPAPCGCVNHVGGEIGFCSVHSAALDLLGAVMDGMQFIEEHGSDPTSEAAEVFEEIYERLRAARKKANP